MGIVLYTVCAVRFSLIDSSRRTLYPSQVGCCDQLFCPVGLVVNVEVVRFALIARWLVVWSAPVAERLKGRVGRVRGPAGVGVVQWAKPADGRSGPGLSLVWLP